MTPTARRVLFLVAIPLESAALRRALGGTRETCPEAVRAWRIPVPARAGTDALAAWIVQTGMGAARAARAAEAALSRFAPDVVVATGCAAALRDDLGPGDVVVAEETAGPAGTLPSDPAWVALYERAAHECSLPVRRGSIWTADAVLASSGDKRRLAARSPSLAVEMEGFAVATVARRANVPFVAVRTILDGLDQSIPAGLVDERGRVRPLRLLASLARDPGLARTLGELRAASSRCARALGALHAAALRGVSP